MKRIAVPAFVVGLTLLVAVGCGEDAPSPETGRAPATEPASTAAESPAGSPSTEPTAPGAGDTTTEPAVAPDTEAPASGDVGTAESSTDAAAQPPADAAETPAQPETPTQEPPTPTEEPRTPTEKPAESTGEPPAPSQEPSPPSEEPSPPSEEPPATSEQPAESPEEPQAPEEQPVPPTSEQPETAPEAPAEIVPWEGWKDDFVGANTCKKCHFKEYRAWKKTPMAQALSALRPTSADAAELRARKVAAGLDPDRDYSADPKCLPCHVTGYGATGGYPRDGADVPDTGVDGVTCEACHGPGGHYSKEKTTAIQDDSNAKFDDATLASWGLVRPDKDVCARCHNSSSPTFKSGDDPFERAHDAGHPKR